MAPNEPLDVTYTISMKNQPFGYGLFNPVPSHELKIGHFGFFDSMGSWNPIANLSDAASLQRFDLKSPAEELDKANAVEMRWAPKMSENVRGFKIGASGSVE
jgi:hypothetical protein